MAHGLVLPGDGQVALVVLLAVSAAIQEEPGQFDVLAALAGSFFGVDEFRQADQGLFEFLVAVVPRLLRGRPDMIAPAIGQPPGRTVHAVVALAGHEVMGEGRFDEIAGRIAFVVALVGPPLQPVQRIEGLQVTVGLLGTEDLGDPIVELLPDRGLGGDDLLVALRIEHQCQAHRLDRVVDVGVGPGGAAMADKRPAGQLVSGLREILDPALGQLGVRQLLIAVRDPMDDDLLEPPRSNGLVTVYRVVATGRRGSAGGGGRRGRAACLLPPVPQRMREAEARIRRARRSLPWSWQTKRSRRRRLPGRIFCSMSSQVRYPDCCCRGRCR